MRAVTIAAAGAAVVGSVSASSHVKHMHAKLHAARDTWADWNTTSTTTTTTTTTTKSVDPATATTTSAVVWEDWDTTTSTTTTTTTTSAADPWADWESTTTTTTKPVDPATTSSDEPWVDWATTVDPADSSSTVTVTWVDWESTSSTPVEPAATSTETWGDWSAVEETTTITLESTKTATKYVEALTSGPAAVTSIITATVVPELSSTGWFGSSLSPAAESCVLEVYTSYGAATWYPTPGVATTTTTAATTTTTTTAVVTTTTTTTTSTTTITTTSAQGWGWAPESPIASPTTSSTTTSAQGWGWAPESPSASATIATGGWGGSPSASPSGSASSSGSTPKPSGGSGGGSSGITANGNSWALTYSPYTSSGGCKDAGTVASDLAIIAQKGFSSVRIYSTDCSSLENVGTAARNNGLKIILGVWISSTGISGAQGQISDIISWGQFDLVELIVVGNESVFNGYCSASELAGFISSSASSFKAAGYTGLVTTTEPLSVWEDSSSASAFLGAVDVCGANLYAFFNADVTADKAGSFIQSEIDILNGICGDKAVYVLESGWPHAGNCNGAACPSPANQATALKGIQNTVGAQVVFLSFEDEPWKAPGQFDVEQYWGCAGVF
ncbi:hypothetical protein PV08_03009 [Exophiala spinifera]|uniref:Probable beta-glucosidase btgE n=1 Tax=Exophiala spinifera TaxID=91928 RepID=A0A0D2BJD9_9EURO|nr:uncharacterized protein PV08_03009 [Exophiala spinifera]KIW18720.1 hypothetical protein PV08_03009 [Exophiala spinifera]